MVILQPVATPEFVGKAIKMSPPAPRVLSLSELQQAAVKSRVVAVLREISKQLRVARVRHGVLGAIAVGIHGWPRATSDVDWLLAREAWHASRDGSLLTAVDLPEERD